MNTGTSSIDLFNGAVDCSSVLNFLLNCAVDCSVLNFLLNGAVGCSSVLNFFFCEIVDGLCLVIFARSKTGKDYRLV